MYGIQGSVDRGLIKGAVDNIITPSFQSKVKAGAVDALDADPDERRAAERADFLFSHLIHPLPDPS